MNKLKLPSSVLTSILVAVIAAIAFIIRTVLSYSQIFKGDWIKYSSADAYYQMRLADNLAANFPSGSNFDPYLLFPGGSNIAQTHLFNNLIATVSSIFGIVTPSQRAIDIVGVFTPPVLAALTVVIVYFIGRELIGKWGGVFSAVLLAILPGEFLSRTKLGFTDYHCFEVFLTSLLILFVILALKAARTNDLRFFQFRQLDWISIRKPLIYGLLAGITLGMFGLTWSGAPMFAFILFVFLLVQFIIDHLKSRSTEYLSIVGTITFFVGFLVVLPGNVSTIIPASSLIGSISCIALGVLSWFMVKKSWKSIYYPVTAIVAGAAGFGLFYLVSPNIVRSMLGSFSVFRPAGAQLTTIEMQPLISASYGNAFAIVWNNYNTTFFIAIISMLLLLYYCYKQGSFEKTLFLVWGIIILILNLGQRRFGYYYSVNIALLTGYFTWLVIDYARAHIFTEKVKQAIARAKDVKRKAVRKQQGNPLIAPYFVMAMVIIVVFFTGYFWSIEPAIAASKQVPYAPSDAWCSVLDWMRENTPEPFDDPDEYYALVQSDTYIPYSSILSRYPDTTNTTGYYKELDVYYPYPDTAYGVLSWWDYGYWITRMAHRLPTANPGQDQRAIKDMAAFFTAQDEETANKVIEKVDGEYIIIDYETAYVNPSNASGKFWAVITWGGMQVADFFDMYLLPNPEDETRPYYQVLYYPEYFGSMAVRMYNFDCQAADPVAWVIDYEQVQDDLGNILKLVTEAKQFTNYEEAEEYMASMESGNYRIVSNNPMVSCIPLEELDNYELVHASEQGLQLTSGNLTPQVKIFQYTK
ncbi:MAG: oligosaccharyl transferase, archaeosortase A system-associated [Dehalococcoidales bacterium]|nr:oligosaccharyl transferase, archaeosortase A system-associated [Dehalococcoidales bacterium]